MDAIREQDGGAACVEAPRADAGIVFLAGMLLAGALTIAATLAFADGPAEAKSAPAAVATR